MSASTTAELLRVLDARAVADAAAGLDGLIRLADNAADELAMLASCAADFPDSDVASAARAGSGSAADAADGLRALRRRLEL